MQALWLWRSNRRLCALPAAPLESALRRSIFRYALGVWSLVLIDSLLWRVEIAFLHGFVSPGAGAIFGVAAQLTQAAILLPCAAITALFPSFAGLSTRRDGSAGELYRNTTALVWAAILPFYFLATAGGLALLPVYGAKYGETLLLLPLVMMSRTMVVAACASSTLQAPPANSANCCASWPSARRSTSPATPSWCRTSGCGAPSPGPACSNPPSRWRLSGGRSGTLGAAFRCGG